MYRIIILGLLTIFLTTIGECKSNQPKQPKPNFCEFDEPLTGRVYNFTTLIARGQDHVLRNDRTNETVKFQLCHGLHTECGTAGGYAACMEHGNETIGIGKYPPESKGKNGSIVFQFTGDECKGDKPYTLSVIMHCDYSESDNKPVLIPYEKKQCDVFISWKTKLACGSEAKSVNCTVKNAEGDLVDLSSLKSQIDNYVIPRDNESSIVLNVCHSVIPGYGAVCLPSAGACLSNDSASIPESRYINLGHVQQPKLINGTVALQYDGGKICTNGEHTQTTIFFICDFTSYRTHPALSNKGCNYELIWRTAAACSDKQLKEHSLKTASPCKINDPVTNFQYDLESLKGQDYIIKDSESSSYKISICGPLTSKACGNAGVCFSKNSTTEGQANSQLLWSPEGPYLNYTNGSLCEGERRHYTIIKFICAPENKNNTPQIVVNEACELKINWPTPLVCENKNIPCDPLESPACSNESKTMTSTVPSVIPSTLPSIVPSPVPPVAPQPIIQPNGTNSDRSMGNSSITTDSGPQSKAENVVTSSSHGGLIAFVVIFIAFGLLCGVYLANPDRRSNLYSVCSSWFLRRSPTRMSYSQVNSVEETNLLLDAPDTCCQSDSDDDLLRI